MYAQLAYKQTIGNSKLPIDVAGCLLIADCDNLEQIGIRVDPLALDAFYTAHGVYSYDRTDRANDDLSWWSVTKYCPQFVVKQIGNGGWPDSVPAKVEFRYKNHLGQVITHFAVVADVASHSIIDTWDGKTKAPAEYEHVYGQPVAWATYTYHTAATIPTSVPPNVNISAPAAVTPSQAPPPSHTPTQLFLPGSVAAWHVYNVNGPYTLPHATHVLDPKMFGGLTYDIHGNPAPNIYLIHTQDYGDVAIYAGPDTVAQFPGTGHGEGETTPLTPDVPAIEVVPAPVIAPSADISPAQPPAPSVVYAKFEQPMNLVTKEGAQSVNFVSGTIVDVFNPDTPFVAVGKATLANNDTYYMDENSFFDADQTQSTPITVGIKTVDLKPSSHLTQAAHVPEAETLPAPKPDDNVITVRRVRTLNPTISWQGTMRFLPEPVMYVTTEDLKVYNFATGNDELFVPKVTPVNVAGTFIFNGRRYYRSQSGVDKDTWYGFPVMSMKRQDAYTAPFDTGDDIDQIGNQVQYEISKTKHASIKTAATASGLLSRLKIKRGETL